MRTAPLRLTSAELRRFGHAVEADGALPKDVAILKKLALCRPVSAREMERVRDILLEADGDHRHLAAKVSDALDGLRGGKS